MSSVRENLKMYWPHLVATGLFAFAAAQYIWFSQWEALMKPMALALLGFVSAVASDEVADWTGTFRWSYDSFWTYPPAWVRVAGFVLLILVNLFGFRR